MNNNMRVEVLAVEEINSEKFFVLKCLQALDDKDEGKIRFYPYDAQITQIEIRTFCDEICVNLRDLRENKVIQSIERTNSFIFSNASPIDFTLHSSGW